MQMLSQTDPFLQKQQINEGLDKSDLNQDYPNFITSY